MRQMDEPKQCFQQMYDRNPIQIQAQFMKQFEASQQRIQVLENLLDIPVAEKKQIFHVTLQSILLSRLSLLFSINK